MPVEQITPSVAWDGYSDIALFLIVAMVVMVIFVVWFCLHDIGVIK